MQEVEELFAALPPKFILDCYFEILSLIGWRAPLEFADEKRFSLMEIKSSLQRNADKLKAKNPYYNRMLLRSLDVAEEVTHVLVNASLLLKEDGVFHRAEGFSRAYYLLKKMKSNAKRQVAWAIWYFHNRGIDSFDASKLLAAFSYKDEYYLSELSDLTLWKEKGEQVKILRKFGNKWKIVEKPPVLSRAFLSLSLTGRLFAAVSRIADSSNVFSDRDIIRKIRELEIQVLKKILSRLGLRQKKTGEWSTDDKALEKVKAILLESLERYWPFFGQIVSRKHELNLKLEFHNNYVDVPNSLISSFMEDIFRLGQEWKSDQSKLYEEALKLKDQYNEKIEEFLSSKWLRFVIRRESFANRIGLQVRINWEQFFQFLENFAQKDLSIEEKYRYLLDCRAPSINIALRADLERTQKEVKDLSKDEIKQIQSVLKDSIRELKSVRDRLYRLASRRKTVPVMPSTLLYLPEMLSTLQSLAFLVENGAIPSCYREMRKILENLAWVVFDDFLFQKMSALKSRTSSEIQWPFPYKNPSREWYEWATKGLMLRNLGQLKSRVTELVNTLHEHMKKDYYQSKEQIEKTVFTNLSYPLFLLLTDRSTQVPSQLPDFIPSYEAHSLAILAVQDLQGILKKLKALGSSKMDKELAEIIVKNLEEKVGDKIVALYPSNQFVLQFIDKVFGSEVEKNYNEKSFFVHSYFASWHIFPYSSVLEFKIFRYELSKFGRIILGLMNSYVKELFKS